MHLFLDGVHLALPVGLACVPVDGHFRRVGKAIREAEFCLQYLVHSAHNEIHNRFGRVPDPARLAL